MANLELYKAHAEAAKTNGAQMIVFPEFGTSGPNVFINRTTVYPYCEEIPVGTNPCENPQKFGIFFLFFFFLFNIFFFFFDSQ